jgi:F-type H+-transporting ATPase subunit alpha
VTRFESELAHELTAKHAGMLASIRTEKQLSSAIEEQLKTVLENFVEIFV